ncbi:uncharacterized protein FIBRA_02502 [Fibroporia radiculosa]|uniref:UBA domain-containing protein n=1 Tax=Fibroporia radiculosa TaxID=599839 RepID=J4H1W2_9APHY|nr:uncharacterized protein FIBRA_02502 [Fibroporia radiculosa]CCM00469.1 predicted protein [Fibroporia radiculosa]
MSDSFADLWNSTGVSKPAEAPRKLGSLTPAMASSRVAQNDAFSMLASAGTSSPASRSHTPFAGPIQSTRSLGLNGSTSNLNARQVQKSVSSGGDAFSGLLSGSLASSSANGAKMTIAERTAQAEKERREQLLQQHATAKQQAAAWAGLDSLGGLGTVTNSSALQSQDDDWGFGFSSSTASATTAKPSTEEQDDWGLEDFVSQPAARKPVGTKPASSLLDFDDLTSEPIVSSSRRSPEPPKARSGTPGDFDFGDREDRLLDDDSNDEDDILGELSKPIPERRPSAGRPARTSPPRSEQRNRAISPPPHILGQIVEMGFSVQQARVALAATDTGLDVQAALETLLSNGAASGSSPPHDRPRQRQQSARDHYYESDEERDAPQRPRTHSAPSTRRSAVTRPREAAPRDEPRDGPSPTGETQRNLQEQADKLIAQASEIGLTMFTRANAFWKEGKEKVQRVYEERSTSRTGEGSSRNGRPRWMQDVPDGAIPDAVGHDAEGGAFRDDDDGEVLPPSRPIARSRPKQAELEPRQKAPERAKTGNLLSDDPPAVYTSPFRRKTPARSQISATAPALAPSPPRAPSPIRLVQRKTVPATSSAIAASAKHKAAGTEMFKLGRYAEAETSYSAAIAALPESHLLLVPLYNNRALARIKTGDHSGAIEDCAIVVSLIGPTYHPAREAKVAREEDGAGVDLADGLVKALWRRAEAYEGKEKWDAARQDWEAVAAAEWAGKARMEAVRGAGRCRRMLNAPIDGGGPSAPSAAPSRPARASKPRPFKPTVVVSNEALNRVREANQAAEAEDQARHELKDSIDGRLAAWKNGKETNIRALIASLDTVLWPELGWQKVGMHELVTPNQVKIRYTKAIAKLHPDKLNVNNTTLEQRMMANGVFGSLNDAWNAFKQ